MIEKWTILRFPHAWSLYPSQGCLYQGRARVHGDEVGFDILLSYSGADSEDK